jgi:eukaryotic-like serine/threonine-protein kinase
MDINKQSRIKSLLQTVLDLPIAEREQWLAQHVSDANEAKELRSLLQHASATIDAPSDHSAVDQPIVDRVQQFVDRIATEASDADWAGVQLGPYRIIEKLGEGGMGAVFLAQSTEIERQVAIKMMTVPLHQRDGLARFRQEIEILARLSHPHIAKLYEVGMHDQRQPWFAMEYVQGVPLDAHVEKRRAALRLQPTVLHREVMQLLAKIARAIHYAHQLGIIHRDLKPANILIDAQGEPKILDFGIARLHSPTSEAAQANMHVRTRMGQLLGTLAYMSPEQLSSNELIDVRADVYALGIIMFELLTGELPVKLSTDSLLEAIRELSESKRKSIRSFHRSFGGEVELIVDAASAPDRSLRYDSASALADDLERYLSNRPIAAKSPSWAYLCGKFIRRNPALTAALSVAVLSLIAATIWSLIAAERARQAQAQSELRTKQLTTVNQFVSNMLAQADPNSATGENLSMKDVLMGATVAFDQLPNDPQIRSAVGELLAGAWNGSGDHERALKYATDALAALRAVDSTQTDQSKPVETEQTLSLERARIIALNELSRYDESIALVNRLLPVAEKQFGLQHPATVKLRAEKMVTLNYLGKTEEALKIGEAMLQNSSATLLAMGEIEYQTVRRNTAVMMRRAGRLHEALAIHQQSWLAAKQKGTDWHPKSLYDLQSLAMVQGQLGMREQALSNFQEAVSKRKAYLGELHPATLASELSVLGVLGELGRAKEAAPYAGNLIERIQKVFGPGHPNALSGVSNYARVLADVGEYEKSVQILRTNIPIAEATPATATIGLRLRNTLGKIQASRGDQKAAALTFAELLLLAKQQLKTTDVALGDYLFNAARTQLALGNREAARRELSEALPILRMRGEEDVDVLEAQKLLEDNPK